MVIYIYSYIDIGTCDPYSTSISQLLMYIAKRLIGQ